MRKITQNAVRAFYSNTNFNGSNTRVVANCSGTYMYLFDNLIARKCGDRVQVSMAGWNTPTTRERLNGLDGVRISSKNYTPYFNGKEMDVQEWYQVGV